MNSPVPAPDTRPPRSHTPLLVACIVFLVVGIHAGAAWAWSGRVYPGVHVGDTSLGGMTPEEVRMVLSNRLNTLIAEGVTVNVSDTSAHLSLETFSQEDPDLSRPIMRTDVEAAVASAMAEGRGKSMLANLAFALVPMLERPSVEIPVILDSAELSRRLKETFPAYHEDAAPTAFAMAKQGETWTITVTPGQDRQQISADAILSHLLLAGSTADVAWLKAPIEVPLVVVRPRVSVLEAEQLIPKAAAILAGAPYHFAYKATNGETFSWSLSDTVLANMLLPGKDSVELDPDSLNSFLTSIEADVNVAALDARMELEGTRVKLFTPSAEGRELVREETADVIRGLVMAKRDGEAYVVVRITQPAIDVEDVNALGIKEALGTGVSSYKGSPANRIKNIGNGARLLHGTLIAPGETFSLLAALRPFSSENGYLPELVIKGDKITPEIGGGLCQIGTTTFRAAMNSGLPVVARQNHSLVVTYYNDPANGNPGTDATIYDPWPDFKFLNDTDNYILFVTENDVTKKELRFTFWGTSDRRKGSYSAPVVDKWIPAGTTREISTADLAPGVRQCQSAHPGAVASFVYTVVAPDGTKNERTFTSSYRPLPTICLVGADPALPSEISSPVSSEPTPVE